MAADDFIRAAAPKVNTPETFWASVREFFGGTIFTSVIRSSVRFPEAAAGYRSILEYAPRHAGSEAYRELAQEVVQRTRKKAGVGA